MRHFASRAFWDSLAALPDPIQTTARRNFEILKVDPRYPSLHLKRAGRYWSVRVGIGYRALGVDSDGDVVWFWIGSHADYDRLIVRGR